MSTANENHGTATGTTPQEVAGGRGAGGRGTPSGGGRGRDGGRGRGGGRGNGGRGRGGGNRAVPVFKGNTDDMKGHVFQCHAEQASRQQFLKTVGVLGEYIDKKLDYPQDIASLCRSFEIKVLVKPDNLDKYVYENDMGAKYEWEKTLELYIKRKDKRESNLRAIFAVIWGQASPMMQSKLESLDEYAERSDECDCIWILRSIQGITHKFEGTRKSSSSSWDAWQRFYTYSQGQHQDLHDYLKEYTAIVQVLDHYGAGIGSAEGPYLDGFKKKVKHETVFPDDDSDEEEEDDVEAANLMKRSAATAARAHKKTLTAVKQTAVLHKKALLMAKNDTIAMGFLKSSDPRRYGALCRELENNFSRGVDQYPVDLTSAYNLLLNY
jgi:hypothetical protein